MLKNEVEQIIHEENLNFYNWYKNREINPNEVGIRNIDGKWSVYASDERANPISEKEFTTESEALENFVKRLRAINKYNRF